MVYLGRPSKGCQMCRTRRIKCDETKPTCNQCAKARRQCPGYRDEFDLLLRNENQAAARRALKANTAAASSSSSSSKKATASNKNAQPHPRQQALQLSRSQTAALTNSLSIPVEDLATCHFLSNFVLVPPQEQHSARGYNHFLLPLLQQYSNGTSREEITHLQHAFNACALASLGERYGAPSPGRGHGRLTTGKEKETLLRKGAEEYTLALMATNAALRDPVRCKEDGTLAAVLLLGMFENITARQDTGSAWGSHVEGAVQLVKARGKKQLKSKLGVQLFVVVRSQLIIHNFITATPLPMGVSWWLNEDANSDPTANACERLNLLTAELRSEVYGFFSSPLSFSSSPASIAAVEEFLARARALDAEAVEWFATLPRSWQIESIPYSSSGNENIFPGVVHVYPDMWTAAIFNLARATRMVLMSIIVRCAAFLVRPGDYRTTAEYAFAARTASSVVSEVIASVPYHLGHLPPRKDKRGNPIENSLNGRGLGGYFLTWPLACVVTHDHVTDAQREYVRGRLRYIGDEHGIKYARVLFGVNLRLPSMLIFKDGKLAAAAAASKIPGANSIGGSAGAVMRAAGLTSRLRSV
ncbi:uncharacterized protein QC763_505650 [Podospora pseudopauciseta]|uniref:Zn(2)-C6 fungal-type domain-containing protein n=2 Tax=Podospora TaxID=5144 RepID=A0ABR0H982_9PEZI|nr:hypothetical protein QC763_505650 [Podospora pseudopauciseta]KAK4675597.1 hypothetical protein QC764_505650 [Podospora pseudoanserina]